MENNEQQEVVNPERRFYVSAIDGDRYGLLLGPFNFHYQALSRVEETRKRVRIIEPKSHFYGFGTCSKAVDDNLPQGKLNNHQLFKDLLTENWQELSKEPLNPDSSKRKKFSALEY